MEYFLANSLLFGNQILSVAYKLTMGLGEKKKDFLLKNKRFLAKFLVIENYCSKYCCFSVTKSRLYLCDPIKV